MARRKKFLTISADGRDKGKKFVLSEMSAWDADRWATRALLALTNAGATIPDNIDPKNGVPALLAAGIRALGQLPPHVAQPLLDELIACVKYEHAPNVPLQDIFPGDACQVEEIATFWTLRAELLELHTGFSLAGATPTSA